ncbi:reverse transcriptase domain-containing protein [Tanacetum coccineum]
MCTIGHYPSSLSNLFILMASTADTSDAYLAQAFTSQCHVTQGTGFGTSNQGARITNDLLSDIGLHSALFGQGQPKEVIAKGLCEEGFFQSDGGTEFVNHTVRKIFEDNGTLHRLSCPYTPQQNGRAERKHRHLVETGLAMLFHAHVPASYWVNEARDTVMSSDSASSEEADSPEAAPAPPDYVPGPEEPEQAPLSLDYVPEPEYPEYLAPSDEEVPIEDQPYAVADSPIALSPDYVADSDLEEDPEEDSEDGPVDYPADGGDDNDDDSSGDDEEEEETSEEEEASDEEEAEEEEEHLAPADSVVAYVVDHVPHSEEIEPFETDESAATPPSPSACRTTARISIRPEAPVLLPPEEEVERLLALPTPPPLPLISLSPPSAKERLARCLVAPALPSSPLPRLPHPYGSPNHVRAPSGDAEKDSSRSIDKGSESTGDLANVLSSMGAINILASGGGSVGNVVSKPMIKFVKETGYPSVSKVNNTKKFRKPTVKYAEMYMSQRPRRNQRNWNNQKSQQLGSDFVMIKKACYVWKPKNRVIDQVPPVSSNVSNAIVTASEKDPTAEILHSWEEDKRKGKEIMIEPEKPAKAKVQEQMSLQLARELQEEFVHEDQSIREQIERDAEIVRIHAEEDLRQMINELDRSNVMINKHMAEYEEAENELPIERRMS